MLEGIIADLADNFREGDESILQGYIDRVTTDALSISNRENTEDNINLLSSEIRQCVKGLYLQRGGEGSQGISDSGLNTTFVKCFDDLRESIVKAGKRVPFI